MNSSSPLNQQHREDPLQYLRVSPILSYSDGEPIYSHADPANHVYLIISGAVKVGRQAGGRAIVTSVHRTGFMFGDDALIKGTRSGSASALGHTKVMVWTPEQLETLGEEHPKFFYALLQIMVERLGNVENRLHSLMVDDARRRLIRALIEFSGDAEMFSKDPDIEEAASEVCVPSVTHEFLGAYIGTTREAVTLFMNLFRRQGLLSYSRKATYVFRDRLLPLLDVERAAGPALSTAEVASTARISAQSGLNVRANAEVDRV